METYFKTAGSKIIIKTSRHNKKKVDVKQKDIAIKWIVNLSVMVVTVVLAIHKMFKASKPLQPNLFKP